jgi:hypothetical protein
MVLTPGNPIEQQQVNQLSDLHTTTTSAAIQTGNQMGFADTDKVKLLLPLDDDQPQVTQANRNAYAQPHVPPSAKPESTKYNTSIINNKSILSSIIEYFLFDFSIVFKRS